MFTKNKRFDFNIKILILGIFALTFLSFLPSLKNGFVQWDDPIYILENQSIRTVSLSNMKKIFSSFVNGNYHPLTILTYSIEYHFSQLNPKYYHATNLTLHLFNIFLVYFFIKNLTKNRFTPLLVMILFGIHPTRVESVAWVTERKDVLFAFFYLLSLIQYVFYLDKGKIFKKFFYYSLIFFVLSLLSKPSAVSLPLILFLIDYYKGRKLTLSAVMEKIPYLLFSLSFGLIAIYGASRIPFQEYYPVFYQYSLFNRIFLSMHSLFLYVFKLFFPIKLSCFYPLPEIVGSLLPVHYYFSGLWFVAAVLLLWKSRRKKIFVFGIVFFLFSIMFNLHLYFVGRVLLADRFTYVSYIGIFFLLAEGSSFIFKKFLKWQNHKEVVIISILIIIAFLCVATFNRCKVWSNTISLWSDVIEKYPKNPLPYYNRGDSYFSQGRINLALDDYNKALKLYPDYPRAYVARGNMYFLLGKYNLALKDYDRAIAYNPAEVNAYLNKGAYYEIQKDYPKALKMYDLILKGNSSHQEAKRKKNIILELMIGEKK